MRLATDTCEKCKFFVIVGDKYGCKYRGLHIDKTGLCGDFNDSWRLRLK